MTNEVEPMDRQSAETEELKVWILMRTDVEMPVGKMLAQAGHAALTTCLAADPETTRAYMGADQPKIAVRVTLPEIAKIAAACLEAGVPHAVITDAGRTHFTEPTITCMGVGPARRADLPKLVKRLRLFA